MKKLSGVIFVLLIAALVLGACKVREFTATPEPTATSAPTEAPAAQATEATAAPTEVVDTRLFDENGRMICTIYEGFFPALTEEQVNALKVFPEITDSDWTLGPKDATLTIMEYSDFQCPACAAFYAELEKLLAKYPDDVRLVFRNFPLVSIHPNAQVAAQAAEAAGLQGKYWEMYNTLFTKQGDWSGLPAEDFLTWLKNEAGTLGLDKERFAADLTSEAIVNKVASDLEYGQTTIGLNSTPTILLNGRPWSYDWSASTLGMVVDVLKYEKGNLETECPPGSLTNPSRIPRLLRQKRAILSSSFSTTKHLSLSIPLSIWLRRASLTASPSIVSCTISLPRQVTRAAQVFPVLAMNSGTKSSAR